MLSYIQEYAPPGLPVGSISFDFVTKSDDMALVRQGDRQPHWSNCSAASLAIQGWIDQLGIANRTCRDCLRLANQRQRRVRTRAQFSMAARCEWPDHPDPDGPSTKASVPEPSAAFDSHVEAGSLAPGLPRLSAGILTRGVKAVRVIPTTLKPSSRNGNAKFGAQDA